MEGDGTISECSVDGDRYVVEEFDDLVECCICQERFVDPRVLPCIHSFCLGCIERAGADRLPGDRMRCPLCRKGFLVPEEGFDGLQKDFRVQGILRLQSRRSRTTAETEWESESDVFCFDCSAVVSVACYFERHRNHRCSHVRLALETFRRQLIADAESCRVWELEAANRLDRVEKEKARFADEVERAKRTIDRRRDHLRQMIEAHHHALTEELGRLENNGSRELESERKPIERNLLLLRRYQKRHDAVKSTDAYNSVSPSDICRMAADVKRVSTGDTCRMAADLNVRFAELRRLRQSFAVADKDGKTDPVGVEFQKTEIEDLVRNCQNNIIGRIEGHGESMHGPTQRRGMLPSDCLTSRRRLKAMAFASSVASAFLLAAVFDGLSGGDGGGGGGTVLVFGLFLLLALGTSLFSFVKLVLPKTVPLRLLQSLDTTGYGYHVIGVTYSKDRIYIASSTPRSCVVAYRNQHPFDYVGEIPTEQILRPGGIVACPLSDSLYITDTVNRCVWKVTSSDEQLVRWLTDVERPHLSVCADGSLIVARHGRPACLEFYAAADAARVDRVQLPSNVGQPHDVVETSTGNLVVSHGTWVNQTHGVCELTRDGRVLRSHMSTESLWGMLKSINLLLDRTIRRDDERLLTIDLDDRVFVADWFNDRVVRFDPRLASKQILMTSDRKGINRPILQLCFVPVKGHLIVVHETGTGNQVDIYSAYCS